jgi:hypothetical protein
MYYLMPVYITYMKHSSNLHEIVQAHVYLNNVISNIEFEVIYKYVHSLVRKILYRVAKHCWP